MSYVVREVRERIERERSRLIEELIELLRYPSVSATGEGIRGCVEAVRSAMEGVGLKVDVYEEGGNPILFGELREERHGTLLIYNHYDVQPPDPLKEWQTPPFSPTIRDGRVFARGATDNKSHLLARLKAIEVLMSLYGEVPVNIKFVVEGEEEIGSKSFTDFVRRRAEMLDADACLWENGTVDESGRPIVHLGAKGMLYLEMEARQERPDLHSSWSPVIENPAWRLIRALSTMRDDGGNVTIEGFYDDVEDLDSSSVQMIETLTKEGFEDYEEYERHSIGSIGSKAEFLRRLLSHPSMNVSGIYSGYSGIGSKTVLPNRAVAKIDVRLVREMRPERVVSLIESHLERHGFKDLELRELQSYPAARTSPDSPIARVALETAEIAYGRRSFFYPYSPTSGPMYLITDVLKIPCVGVGFFRKDSHIHAPNENVRVEDYLNGIEHIALILANFVPYMRWGEMPYR
ncbi:MAG: M20/M25/M40 family metallo-hydrolase [Aigarchaeota archaeon]|nr:M20/M25/M40 family metallo-hydrolase [Aigarchaeota archaeon]MDW8092688.1 M20/M25/M40 family metallo-hydrolase [Nitrososphaerota archaeon]